jgi:hypothetical protein
VLFELGLVLVHLFGARCPIVIAEDTEQWTAEVLGQIDWRDRRLGVELFLSHYHATAPKFDTSVDVPSLASIDEGVPATGAGAEDADLAVVIGLSPRPLHGGLGITDHLGVGKAGHGKKPTLMHQSKGLPKHRTFFIRQSDKPINDCVCGSVISTLQLSERCMGECVDQSWRLAGLSRIVECLVWRRPCYAR